MTTVPAWLDTLVRGVLGLPGWLLERVDGGAMVASDTEEPPELVARVRESARHPEAYLALEPGLRHHMGEHGVVAWQHRGRTAFAVGGLNVSEGRIPALLSGFRQSARAAGVARQLLFPVRASERTAALEAGFQSLQVGVEAWLDLSSLTFAGKRYETVRQMRNRARRRGVQVAEVDPRPVRGELQAVHDAWLAAKRPSWRMRLLVGSPNLERPLDRRYLVARSDRGVEGFVTLTPGAPGTWGVDVMCRRPDAVAGTMERLIVHAVEVLRAEGATALSLGPCPMAGVPLQGDRRALRWVFHLLFRSSLGNQLFGFRALYAFKDKFRPRWEPVYFAAAPRLGWLTLYRGCRMWGLY